MFSIIVPLYNKAPFIEKTINSVFLQTFKNFELIVVDDGSTDDSLEKLLFIQEQLKVKNLEEYSKLKVIKQSNQGVSIARNNGVKEAKYDFIAFLDADDWWDPTFLEEIFALIKEYPEAAIYVSSYYKVKHGINYPAQIGVSESFEKGYLNYFEAYSKSLWMPIWTGASVISKEVFNKVGGFNSDLTLGEDLYLWLKITLTNSVAFVNKPLSFYNQDVDLSKRAIGRLHNPQSHILFNLDNFDEEERNNSNLKQLLDNLRTYGLFPYYLNNEYRMKAKIELQKVNWDKQPRSMLKKYRRPIFILNLENSFFVLLSKIKMKILK